MSRQLNKWEEEKLAEFNEELESGFLDLEKMFIDSDTEMFIADYEVIL